MGQDVNSDGNGPALALGDDGGLYCSDPSGTVIPVPCKFPEVFPQIGSGERPWAHP